MQGSDGATPVLTVETVSGSMGAIAAKTASTFFQVGPAAAAGKMSGILTYNLAATTGWSFDTLTPGVQTSAYLQFDLSGTGYAYKSTDVVVASLLVGSGINANQYIVSGRPIAPHHVELTVMISPNAVGSFTLHSAGGQFNVLIFTF